MASLNPESLEPSPIESHIQIAQEHHSANYGQFLSNVVSITSLPESPLRQRLEAGHYDEVQARQKAFDDDPRTGIVSRYTKTGRYIVENNPDYASELRVKGAVVSAERRALIAMQAEQSRLEYLHALAASRIPRSHISNLRIS